MKYFENFSEAENNILPGQYATPAYNGPTLYVLEENGTQRGKPKLFSSDGYCYVKKVFMKKKFYNV